MSRISKEQHKDLDQTISSISHMINNITTEFIGWDIDFVEKEYYDNYIKDLKNIEIKLMDLMD